MSPLIVLQVVHQRECPPLARTDKPPLKILSVSVCQVHVNIFCELAPLILRGNHDAHTHIIHHCTDEDNGAQKRKKQLAHIMQWEVTQLEF